MKGAKANATNTTEALKVNASSLIANMSQETQRLNNTLKPMPLNATQELNVT